MNCEDKDKVIKEKSYIAIDLKSFYASVECIERGLDPLTTNLVVADPDRTSKTICLAVSPSLKAYGLSGRSRLFEVEQKADEVLRRTGKPLEYIVAVPRMSKYITCSGDIYTVYLKYFSPQDIVVYSVDEVFIDATDYLTLYGQTAEELAKTVIQDVFATTGITATAGVAPNLYLCKVAMDIVAKHIPADKDGVRVASLDVTSYRKTLWKHRPLTDFWRVGVGTARKLEQSGIYTMGDIARFSLTGEDWLFKSFGVDAEILIDHAWGIEPCTVEQIHNYKPSVKSTTTGQVLHCPYDAQKCRIIIREMAEELVLNLVDKNLKTDSVTLVVGYDRANVDQGTYRGAVVVDRYGRTIPKSATGTAALGSFSSSTKKIVKAVLETYDRIIDPSLLIRRINMSANNVVEDGFEQYDLFTDPKELEKERKMQKAMLEIHKRFGKNAMVKGSDLVEGATTMERNRQIGGHRA